MSTKVLERNSTELKLKSGLEQKKDIDRVEVECLGSCDFRFDDDVTFIVTVSFDDEIFEFKSIGLKDRWVLLPSLRQSQLLEDEIKRFKAKQIKTKLYQNKIGHIANKLYRSENIKTARESKFPQYKCFNVMEEVTGKPKYIPSERPKLRSYGLR